MLVAILLAALAGPLDLPLARLADTSLGGPLALPGVLSPERVDPRRRIHLYAEAVGSARRLETAIEALGGEAVALTDTLVAARVPLGRLPALAALPNLRRAELAAPKRPLLDRSVPAIGADRILLGSGLERPLTGRGVILGLVDTGLDYRHPAFDGDDGRSRVLALWDQNVEGTPPPGFHGGHLCDRASIVEGRCDAVDLVGHGTHVAATAGGRDPLYRGVAPDVAFLVVRSLSFEDLGSSAKWIFDEAERLGRPCVINMSLGGHFGPHDGSSLESRALTELTGPGRILVVAAGNEGDRAIHLAYPLETRARRTELILHPGFASDGGFVDLWASAGARIEIAVEITDREGNVAGTTGFLSPSETFNAPLIEGDRTLGQVQIAWQAPHPETGKVRANVVVAPSSEPDTFAGNAAGWRWYLLARGEGHFDAWISSGAFLSPPAEFGQSGEAPGDSESTVAMPGVARGAITVAAWTTRNSWVDVDGETYREPERVVGEIAFFSSRGPSVDPARTGFKPEIAAPGQYVAAPFGANALVFDRRMLLEEDVVAMRGTSMAAPHVAGTVALLLEADPTLDPEAVEALLTESARTDVPGVVPGPRWGFGALDALAAARALLPAPQAPAPAPAGCACTAGSADGPPAWGLLLLAAAALLRPSRRW